MGIQSALSLKKDAGGLLESTPLDKADAKDTLAYLKDLSLLERLNAGHALDRDALEALRIIAEKKQVKEDRWGRLTPESQKVVNGIGGTLESIAKFLAFPDRPRVEKA